MLAHDRERKRATAPRRGTVALLAWWLWSLYMLMAGGGGSSAEPALLSGLKIM
jgi:hypothetical protein